MITELINNEAFAFEEIVRIIDSIHLEGPVNQSDLETLSYIKLYHPKLFSEFETKILYVMGLFFKVSNPSSFIEQVYSIFSSSIVAQYGSELTPTQADAYSHIKEKVFFSLSAPTSSGKSFLFRELILNETNDIIIVVPSRALIAEYLITVKSFVDNSVLVLQFIDNINISKTRRRVFIITPERGVELFKYKKVFEIGLVLFDEAQLSEDTTRGLRFDAFVRRISREFPLAKKVFAHPYVNNPEAQLQKHNIASAISSYRLYKQNSVGKIFVAVDDTGSYYFSPFRACSDELVKVEIDFISNILASNGSVLIYTSKSSLYNGDFLKRYKSYLRYCPKVTDPVAKAYIMEIREYIGADDDDGEKTSLIVNLMKRGIVIHHGSMPLRMRLIIEKFVRANFARLCFATSTLNQGINMPFDAVFIDNFRSMDILTLKNLIGRSGRTTNNPKYDFGYTLIHYRNLTTFCSRMRESFSISPISQLESTTINDNIDKADIVEAIKANSFDDKTHLTKTQMQRIEDSHLDEFIIMILDTLFFENRILSGNEYYKLIDESTRTQIKDSFKAVYVSHLRRSVLTQAEETILSASIPLLLWQIQGRSFKEILALRYSYLTQKSEQQKINSDYIKGRISKQTALKQKAALKIKFSIIPSILPNVNAPLVSTFGRNIPVANLDYDTLVYDTYDYLDKVIGLSLSDPICAAFEQFYEKTGDKRAKSLCNYIQYGTDQVEEIWLLRYGFEFEDFDWLVSVIDHIDENGITFNIGVDYLSDQQKDKVARYI